MSTGEASGDMLAATLAEAMRGFDSGIEFCGIGSERMLAAGFRLTAETRRWATIGIVDALIKALPLWMVMWRHALRLRMRPVDLVVLVDFGAFNLGLAKTLRMLGYARPVLYYFPPGAWFDSPSQARKVARYTHPLTAFAHQRDFYSSLGLPIAYFGHPLGSLIAPRAARPPAPADGGTVAVLAGSRRGEVRRHAARLFAACELLRERRSQLDVVIGAADADTEALLRGEMERSRFSARIVRGARAALDGADAAFIASGTAVLEAALLEVPCAALYVLARAQMKIAERVWHRRYVTLPNILLEREIVPELLQDAATPRALADTLASLLHDPAEQLAALREVRVALGARDALARCAEFAISLAQTGTRDVA
jgi:lipid-A-disaccharide synthase